MEKMKLAVLLAVFALVLGAGTVAAQFTISLPPITIGPQCASVTVPAIPSVNVCLFANGSPQCVTVPGNPGGVTSVCATLSCSATTAAVTALPGAPNACPAGSTPVIAQTVELAASAACTLSTIVDGAPGPSLSTPPPPDPQSVEVCVATGP